MRTYSAGLHPGRRVRRVWDINLSLIGLFAWVHLDTFWAGHVHKYWIRRSVLWSNGWFINLYPFRISIWDSREYKRP